MIAQLCPLPTRDARPPAICASLSLPQRASERASEHATPAPLLSSAKSVLERGCFCKGARRHWDAADWLRRRRALNSCPRGGEAPGSPRPLVCIVLALCTRRARAERGRVSLGLRIPSNLGECGCSASLPAATTTTTSTGKRAHDGGRPGRDSRGEREQHREQQQRHFQHRRGGKDEAPLPDLRWGWRRLYQQVRAAAEAGRAVSEFLCAPLSKVVAQLCNKFSSGELHLAEWCRSDGLVNSCLLFLRTSRCISGTDPVGT